MIEMARAQAFRCPLTPGRPRQGDVRPRCEGLEASPQEIRDHVVVPPDRASAGGASRTSSWDKAAENVRYVEVAVFALATSPRADAQPGDRRPLAGIAAPPPETRNAVGLIVCAMSTNRRDESLELESAARGRISRDGVDGVRPGRRGGGESRARDRARVSSTRPRWDGARATRGKATGPQVD